MLIVANCLIGVLVAAFTYRRLFVWFSEEVEYTGAERMSCSIAAMLAGALAGALWPIAVGIMVAMAVFRLLEPPPSSK